MNTSTTQTELLKALFAAQGAFPTIPKTKKGQAGNRSFMYAPLENIRDIVQPILRANGLMVTHSTDGHTLVTRLEHVSGEWRECSMPVNAEHANMQSYGIEITYRRRYSVQLVLGIVTEEDTDGHGESKVTAPPEAVERINKITSVKDLAALFKSMPEKERAPLVNAFGARRKELESA